MKSKVKLLICAIALSAFFGLGFESFSDTASARPDIVKDGKPNAEIIISDKPTRSMKVAASELQANIQKISGAKLPIATSPNKEIPVKIYVGKSQYTDALKINVDDLKNGAYKMISGDNWMALIGRDNDYVFREPYCRTLEDKTRVQAEWERITGAKWNAPYGANYLRHYNKELDLWYLDERGSINAVYRFLQDLGMRWYLPDELGEIIPEKKTIQLPDANITVKPDFALRNPHSVRYFANTAEALWMMRMGWNLAPDIVGPSVLMGVAHGMSVFALNPENRKANPEFFAIINGKRFMPDKNPSFCLSSEKLIDQNVRFLRAVFDTYDPLMVSVQPADSNVLVCQCEKCAGKETPDRGRRGDASDYVWEYVNRVAKELYKTHPKKKIAALAYANYQLPPTKIAQLSPNIIVGTPSGRTFTHNNPEETALIGKIEKEWLDKLPEGSKMTYRYEYFMDARPGRKTENLPVFVMHSVARSLREAKGHCIGEHIDVARLKENFNELGVLGLNLYTTSKLWWNADQDIAPLLEEYYRLYYGPAAEKMKKLIEYSEAHWTEMPSKPETIKTYFALLSDAQAAVPADSVYGRRIDLLWQYTKPMKSILEKLAQPRDESIPPVTLHGTRPPIKPSDIKIDGKMDEKVWQDLPGKSTPEHLDLATYQLRDIVTGAKPVYPTTFKTFWADGALYMGIRCVDPDAKNLNIATRTRDDGAIWNGDLIELHLETQSHSYYALVINPAGTLVDLDWKDKKRETAWNSNAEVATQIDDKGWTIEIRIPVVDEQEAEIVELGNKGVMGRQPTKLYPWYMNLIRQRVRDAEKECTAYSPTGSKAFHNPSKFARLSSAK